jgi:hypothetical protein
LGPPGGFVSQSYSIRCASTFRTLGIDPSLRNLGWQVRDYGPEVGVGVRVAGGTVVDHDAQSSLVRRLVHVAAQAHTLVALHHPHLVVLEGPLTHGLRRSPTGLALFALIVRPWLPGATDTGVPRWVVVLHPARLASLAREDAKPTARSLKARYRRDTGDERRCSEHEVDAFFCAHFGTRFLRSLVVGDWPRANLTEAEQEAFLFGTKRSRSGDIEEVALLARRGHDWWALDHVAPAPDAGTR